MVVFLGLRRFYHTTLGHPFRLAVRLDKGQGTPIIFLHGIAADYRIWSNTLSQLQGTGRLIALDLLGCGESPKPSYLDYTVSEHAKSVILTLRSLRINEPIVLVGHSLGSLVALEVARIEPELVSRLILASPPIFTKDINGLASQIKNSLYNSAYLAVIRQPRLTTEATVLVQRLQPSESNYAVTKDSWTSFRQTLQNAVLDQANYNTLLATTIPTDIVYGRFDVLILKKPLTTAVEKNNHLAFHRINEPHEITSTYSNYIVKLIRFILHDVEARRPPSTDKNL